MSLVSIGNEALTVTISTKGAELQSVQETDGTERLWQGDPAFWASRAPIMFPICGGLREDAYYLNGERYEMPKHGFARKAEWTVEKTEKDEAVFLLTQHHPGFPFQYELRAAYRVEGNALTVTYTINNQDTQDFCCSLGSHEAWATPGGLEHYTVEFDHPERLEDYVLEGNLINHTPVLMGENARKLPLKTEYFAVDALVFPYLRSRSVTLKSNLSNKTIQVEYEGMDVLMLWTKPGADYICIEPWCNAPDFVDADMQILHKPGVLHLYPGQSESKTHRMIFR